MAWSRLSGLFVSEAASDPPRNYYLPTTATWTSNGRVGSPSSPDSVHGNYLVVPLLLLLGRRPWPEGQPEQIHKILPEEWKTLCVAKFSIG